MLNSENMEPERQNPYDFILSKPADKKGFRFDAASKKQRIIVVAIGAMVLIIIAVLIFSLLGNMGKKDLNQLYQISASQQDLIELTGLGARNARATALVGQSTTAGIIITGQNKDTNAYITSLKVKNYTKKITPYRNTSYIKLLDEARKNGNYDDTYTALYSNRLDAYSSLLNKTYSASGNKKIKDMLAKFFSQLDPITNRKDNNN
jgi:hypothetical protein